MALATCELVWIKQLLQELKFCEIYQMKLCCDYGYAKTSSEKKSNRTSFRTGLTNLFLTQIYELV